MAIYDLGEHDIQRVPSQSFAQLGLLERDIQTLVKRRPEVIVPETLIIAEEFSDWEDSQRRIDLLGLDTDANIVVIELKRTEDGGHMELQAIRYAAMVSAMSFDMVVSVYERHLQDNGRKEDARERLYAFLGWHERDDEILGDEVRVVLASAEFSRELTTSVLWLNDHGLDIRCVRMRPYENNGQRLLEVQTIIPLPETAGYQVKLRERKKTEQAARASSVRDFAASSRDYGKYDLIVAGNKQEGLNKRRLMLCLVRSLLDNGCDAAKVAAVLGRRKIASYDGELEPDQVRDRIKETRHHRYFLDELFRAAGKTYVLSNQSGTDTEPAVQKLAETFPDLQIEFTRRG